jgi:hypothetical protein
MGCSARPFSEPVRSRFRPRLPEAAVDRSVEQDAWFERRVDVVVRFDLARADAPLNVPRLELAGSVHAGCAKHVEETLHGLALKAGDACRLVASEWLIHS